MSFISGNATQKRNYNLILGDSGSIGPAPCVDGPVWSNVNLPANTSFLAFSVAASPTSLVVVGYSPATFEEQAYYSLDNGTTWLPCAFPAGSFVPRSAAYGGGSYIAFENNGGKVYYSLDDGVNWSAVNTGLGTFGRMSFANGVWFGRLDPPVSVARSTDGGVSWALPASFPAITGLGSNITGKSGITLVAGYVAPNNGRIITSIDGGVNWSASPAPWTASNGPIDIAYSPTLDLFVGVNGSSDTWVSSDGVNWSLGGALPNNGTNNWGANTWGDAVFLAVNRGGSGVAVSTDGLTWNLAPNSVPVDAWALANNGSGTWVAQRQATPPASINTIIVGAC